MLGSDFAVCRRLPVRRGLLLGIITHLRIAQPTGNDLLDEMARAPHAGLLHVPSTASPMAATECAIEIREVAESSAVAQRRSFARSPPTTNFRMRADFF